MKKRTAIFLAAVLVFCLFGCSSDETVFEITGAESLVITSGSTGDSITVTDAGDIGHITDSVCGLSYSKGSKVDSDGWSYSLKWLDKDGSTIESLTLLGDGTTVIRDGYYYKANSTDTAIDLEFIAALLGGN